MCSDHSSPHIAEESAITLSNIHKRYALYNSPRDRLMQFFMRTHTKLYREHHALNAVTLDIKRGETLGIVGRNGSGKSTLLQIITGTLQADSGSMEVAGRISALLELGAGFNPEFTGEENVYLNGAVLGMSREEVEDKFDAILSFAGIGGFIHQPVKNYSSGMVVRLAFAVATAADPDILVVDEALAVGDEAFQSKCFTRIRQIQERGGTILFVSHAMPTIVELCNRAVLLDEGEILTCGTPKEVVAHYHRLAHAQPERRNALRAAIREGENTAISVSDGHSVIPESQICYPSEGANISNPRIVTLAGEHVTTLETGQRYLFQIDVIFEQQPRNLHVGMMIKSVSGIELGGKNCTAQSLGIHSIEDGEVCSVSMGFTCHLASGCYYMNAGVSEKSPQGTRFLHRIIDALEFRVAHKASPPIVGAIDFEISANK